MILGEIEWFDSLHLGGDEDALFFDADLAVDGSDVWVFFDNDLGLVGEDLRVRVHHLGRQLTADLLELTLDIAHTALVVAVR
jgi:hypothetical protein